MAIGAVPAPTHMTLAQERILAIDNHVLHCSAAWYYQSPPGTTIRFAADTRHQLNKAKTATAREPQNTS